MIKATDLRISNLIKWSGGFHKVEAINPKNITVIRKNLEKAIVGYSCLRGIPLTEEILLKCNAKESNKKFTYGRFQLTWQKSYNYWYVVDLESFLYLNKIEFLHEWQNFIFVMDGTELDIKL